MALKDKQAFIKELATEQRRRRPLMRPSARAMLWFMAVFIVSAVWMHSVQVFRPGFAGQLVHHPFFMIEIASALLFSAAAAYVLFTRSTPGERTSRGMKAGLWILAVLFVIGFAAGFSPLAPETSTVGARHECWLEVVKYGAFGLGLFIVMIRRGFIRFSWKRGVLYGLIAGLVPAALMQLACMFNPMHALIFHYLPVVVLVPVGLLAMRIIQRR